MTCRLERLRQRDRFVAVGRFAHDVDRLVVFEDAAEAAPDERVVVGEQHGDLRCQTWRLRCASRHTSRTSVPPRRPKNSIVPPTSAARSRIADDAEPAPWRHGGDAGAVILDLELQEAART